MYEAWLIAWWMLLLGLAWWPCCCDESCDALCTNCTGDAPCTYTVTIEGMSDDSCTDCASDINGSYIAHARGGGWNCFWDSNTVSGICGGEFWLTLVYADSGEAAGSDRYAWLGNLYIDDTDTTCIYDADGTSDPMACSDPDGTGVHSFPIKDDPSWPCDNSSAVMKVYA